MFLSSLVVLLMRGQNAPDKASTLIGSHGLTLALITLSMLLSGITIVQNVGKYAKSN